MYISGLDLTGWKQFCSLIALSADKNNELIPRKTLEIE